MQLREVLFQIRIVWSSEVEIYRSRSTSRNGIPERDAYNPGHLMVKLNSADIVEMSVKSEEAPPVLRPDVYAP